MEKILSTYGQTGENIENTKPSYRPEVVFIPGKYDELDIIIQVSNFHYTKGGIWQPIFIGEEDALILKRSRSVITEVFLAGSIFVMFIYNLALYFAFRKEQASLYFALVCLLVSIRTISLDEYLIQEIIPISWFWVIKVEYLTYYITVLAFQEFAIAIFKRNFYWLIAYISRVIISIFIAIVLFSPTTFYTSILIYFHSITLLLCFYFFTVLIKEMSRRFHQTKYYFFGWVFLFVTLLNDVLYNLHVIETGNFGALGTFIFMGFLYLYTHPMDCFYL